MVIHSDSELGVLFLFAVLLASGLLIFVAMMSLLDRNFRFAGKMLAVSAGLFAAYALAVVTVSVLTPQQIVKVGDMYCADIWCITIENVSAVQRGQNMEYNLGVRLYSDANTTTISAKGIVLYLLDDRGRRFPMLTNTAAIPIDASLQPHETIRTSMSFLTASDVRQLYLMGDDSGHKIPLLARFFVSLYFGADSSLMHKPTLLRVL